MPLLILVWLRRVPLGVALHGLGIRGFNFRSHEKTCCPSHFTISVGKTLAIEAYYYSALPFGPTRPINKLTVASCLLTPIQSLSKLLRRTYDCSMLFERVASTLQRGWYRLQRSCQASTSVQQKVSDSAVTSFALNESVSLEL